ncbi:hypothetical protein PRUPE_3G152400 [Prunus persica]|uniref:Methionyl-tRNA formyltransferase n=1 Tax=Prunus persica TaxID=3760 RepID=A0A251Q0K1_PRUPE|nr:hypothetical protein PRUPE_3G152400 [Prunus persica]
MNSSLVFRRFWCFNAATSSSSTLCFASNKKPLVFLGSPQVSATVLDALLNASTAPDSLFEVAAIVTQPPSRKSRGKKLMPSPLAQHALDRGFPSNLIFTPERAGEARSIYTQVFCHYIVVLHPFKEPCRFLCFDVPYLDGVKETGVSLAFTVRALDAGPVIACERMEIEDQIKAPELLDLLFYEGSKLLIRELPSIFDGSAKVKAQPQDDSKATLAPKIASEESWLSFDEEAPVLHNKGGLELELKL